MQPKASNSKRPAWARYGVAVGSVVVGWLAREALTSGVGPTALPFIFFFPAAAMAAWYGGFGPGVVATVLGAVTANWFFIEPIDSWSISKFGDAVALGAFLISCLFIVGAIEMMHRARARLLREIAERERVETELAQLRETFASTLGSVREVAGATDAPSQGPFLKVDAGNAKRGARLISVIFLAAAGLLVASTIFVYRAGLIRINAQDKMASQLLVLQQLDDFLSTLKDAQIGERGYLLTGDESYLQPYTNVRAQVQTKLEGLQRLVLSGELPQDKVGRVAVLTQQKLPKVEQTIELRRDKGLDAALAIVRENQGKQLMDEIRTEIGQMRAEEEKEFAAATDRENRAGNFRTATFVGACLLNLVFLGWAFRKISREVGGREAAVLEASQQKELLATTLASIGDAVIVTDAEGRITFLNAEAETLTGWKSSEAAGRPLAEIFRIINERTRQPAENPVEKVLRVGGVVGLANHTILIAKDGREIPIDDSAAPIRQPDGPLFGVVLVFRDFTEHKQAERALRESQERLVRLINSAMDAIVAVDAQQRITMFNPAAERMFGCLAAEAIGGPLDRFIPQRFRGAHRGHVEKFGQTGVTNRRMGALMTLSGLRTNGEEFPIEASISQVEVGGQKTFKVILRDITERKRAEDALQQAQSELQRHAAELETTVERRTADLRETVQQLETFSYSIVHDMRAPLRSMRSFASFLQDEYRDKFDETGRTYLRRIMDSAARMDTLITDVLTYSRISSGETALGRVNLDKLVTEIVEQYPQFQEAKPAIHVEHPLPTVSGNTALLTQVISNLLGNALKFMPPDRAPSVTVRAQDGAGRVRLWVEDNGIGIPPQQHEKIFGLFQRLHRPDEYPGTGVGLAIVKKAAERMRGATGVESELGKGSRFWVELDGVDGEHA